MNKVIITQDQADAIVYGLTVNPYYKGNTALLLHDHNLIIKNLNSKNCWLHEMSSLNDMEFMKLSDALHLGYEVAQSASNSTEQPSEAADE